MMMSNTARPTAARRSSAAASHPDTFRYSAATVAVHWFMAALLTAVFATIELRVLYAKGTEMRDFMKALHFMLGLSVLLMVALRLAARFTGPKPVAQATHSWADWAARLGHGALYALMIGMPILGWLALSAAGKPIPFFGLELPALVSPDKALATRVKELHETLGTTAYWLIGIHVAAALGHHYLLKDGLLSRMSFGARR